MALVHWWCISEVRSWPERMRSPLRSRQYLSTARPTDDEELTKANRLIAALHKGDKNIAHFAKRKNMDTPEAKSCAMRSITSNT